MNMMEEEEEEGEGADDNVNDGEAEVLTPSDLLKAQFDAIEEVNSVLSVSRWRGECCSWAPQLE
jgi:hypothetical protein